jgi:sulfide:quinone oxidoreductase
LPEELDAAHALSNVCALGDVASSPNSKTAAAVRKQAPVVVGNILRMMGKTAIEGVYDGYASCPLTTAVGKAILAEFIYGGKVTPTLPLNPAKEHWIGWWIQGDGPAADVLELHAQRTRVVPEA